MKTPARQRLNVLIAAAEIAPWQCCGRLASAVANLAEELAHSGRADVTVLAPLGPATARSGWPTLKTAFGFDYEFAKADRKATLRQLPAGDLGYRLLFLDDPGLFGGGDDIYDRPTWHWLAFAKALRPALRAAAIEPDVIHVHDWPAAFALALDRTDEAFADDATECAAVLSVHDARFQGRMSTDEYVGTGLRHDLLSDWYALDRGEFGALKAGLVFADKVIVPSPSHALELQIAPNGFGLEPVFESRGPDIVGINQDLKGDLPGPTSDDLLDNHFSAEDLAGKARTARQLMSSLGLSRDAGPLFVCLSQLTGKTGNALAQAASGLLRFKDTALVVIAEDLAEAEARPALERLAEKNPSRVAVLAEADTRLRRHSLAGADFQILPESEAPSGEPALAALAYGTIPLARLAGAHLDLLCPYRPDTRTEANAFCFGKATGDSILSAMRAAIGAWREKGFRALQSRAIRRSSVRGGGIEPFLHTYEAAIDARRNHVRDMSLLAHIRLEPETGELPEHRALPATLGRDTLRMMLQDPTTLHLYWRLDGPDSRAFFESLDEDQRTALRFTLEMEELNEGHAWAIDLDGVARDWFVNVTPERRYRASLVCIPPAGERRTLARSGEVETPPAIDPGTLS